MVSVKKRAKAKYSRIGKPNLSTMNHRELGEHIADAVPCAADYEKIFGRPAPPFGGESIFKFPPIFTNGVYAEWATEPTIQHVRNIMGEAVLEQDHIKFLAARVTMFNISKMGDL